MYSAPRLYHCNVCFVQMGRTYVRKSERGSWSEESMRQAIIALDEGKPLKTCATQFNVPRNTLRRHWMKRLKKHPGCRHLSRQSILGPLVEKDLADYIIHLEDKGFGLTPTDVRELAFDYAERNNIQHSFDRNLKVAGLDWWSGFRQRHRALLSIRKPEALSLARAAAMNRPAISKYFNILEREMNRLGVTDKPSCMYNCDESGLSLVPDTCKVVARKGKKNVYQVTSAERGVLTTVLPCYNASGYYLPPLIIYKGKRLTDGLTKNMPAGTRVVMSDTGYMNKEVFQIWLEHFKMNLQEPNSPALLILDGHGSHVKAIDGLKFAERNNISIVCPPPHTTHWTQPQDRSYFKPLKSNYAHECRKFMRDNPGKVITRYNFGQLFTAAYHKTSSMAIAFESFRVTGIYPLNKNIFPDDVFAPSQTTDRELPPSDHQNNSGNRPTISRGQSERELSSSSAADIGQINRPISEQTASPIGIGGDINPSSGVVQSSCVDAVDEIHHAEQVNSAAVIDNNNLQDLLTSVIASGSGDNSASRPMIASKPTSSNVGLFEQIKPLPKKLFDDNTVKRKRKSRATSARVLTS